MRYKNSLQFKGALVRSVFLHVLILAAVLVNVTFKNPDKRKLTLPVQAQTEPVIEAVAITEKELQRELDRLNKIEEDKLAEQRRIIAEQERLKREQEAERQRLAELKRQQEEAAKKLAEEKRLADEAQKRRLAEEAAAKKQQEELARQQAAEQALREELARQEAAEQTRQEELARQKAAEDALQQKLAAEEAERQALLAAQQAEHNRLVLREVDRYKLMVQQAIMRHWLIQGNPDPEATTLLAVRLSPNGTVLNVQLKSSSGNVAQDRSAIAAVYKASPLPVPEDPEIFKSFRELTLILRPDSVISEG
jgi:colicin import membrane protein